MSDLKPCFISLALRTRSKLIYRLDCGLARHAYWEASLAVTNILFMSVPFSHWLSPKHLESTSPPGVRQRGAGNRGTVPRSMTPVSALTSVPAHMTGIGESFNR